MIFYVFKLYNSENSLTTTLTSEFYNPGNHLN